LPFMTEKITKNHGYQTTATERMTAARAVKHEAITRELCWASIASRFWPSCLMPPKLAQLNYPFICVIETPAGRIVYRVSTEELPLFEHLQRRANDGADQADKSATLLALAVNGWESEI